MLTRIERPDGEVISFSYKQDGIPIVVHDYHYGFVYTGTYGLNSLGDCGFETFDDPNAKNNLSVTFLCPLYLESISCRLSGDSLEFNSSQSQELSTSSVNQISSYVLVIIKDHLSVSPTMTL